MKRIMFFVMTSLLMSLSCGNSVDLGNCQEYCSTMDRLGAFGSWDCYALEKVDNLGYCSEIIITSTDDPVFSASADGDMDAESAESTLIVRMCYREKPAGSPRNDGLYGWRTVTNPLNNMDCINQCEVSTQGDSLPEALELAIQNASNTIDFLAAELNQQCVIRANES